MMRTPLHVLLALAVATIAAAADVATPRRPNVVFLLLDTTRADRMSAWGNQRRTTPHLDALAADGIRFARHFANSHATRPSMPQILTGRYYQASVLRTFRPRTHPRDWPFARPDPTLALLPDVLKGAGYVLYAVSAHPWVSRASRFGEPFDRFEEPDVPAARGHADAGVVVDRALSLWRRRPTERPVFLYLHFMDPHIPRHVPPGELRFGDDDPEVRRRFDEAGEPLMENPWHDWDRGDARTFTARDVAFFTSVYDTLLFRLDTQIGRLLEALRHDDPDLSHTLVVVTADHGEELGEHGRISHEDSLADAVQHIPWILAGTNVEPGQTAWGVSEGVDVLPTLLAAIDVRLPPAARVDGHSVVEAGRVCRSCLRTAPVYAWEDYRAVRLGKRLVREPPPETFAARCHGRVRLLDEARRHPVDQPRRRTAGATMLAERLDGPEIRFRAGRFDAPETTFSVLAPFWRVGAGARVACVDAGPATDRASFDRPGWIWTGRGLTLLRVDEDTRTLPLELEVPDGTYEVDLGVRTLPPPPWLFGYDRWLRKRLRRRTPKEHVAVGTHSAAGGRLRLVLEPRDAVGRHVLTVRLRPLDRPLREAPTGTSDPTLTERLRRLGYVE